MALLIVGVTEDGAAAFSAPLDHGADPDTVVFDHGYQAVRPLEAGWRGADLALRLRVRPLRGEPRPEPLPPRTDAGLIISDDVVPVTRQRVAAYAVVLSRRGLLATEYSDQTAVPGRWGMPGGGMDDQRVAGRSASAARCTEETAQQIVLGDADQGADRPLDRPQPRRHDRGLPCRPPDLPGQLSGPRRPGRAGPRRQHGLRPLGGPRRLDRGLAWTANWMMILSELLPTSEV